MAHDTAALPKELLNLRIKDIEFQMSSIGKQYAEVHIKISKTKPRSVPLIFSIPYIKDWIDYHPMAANPDSYLFISLADRYCMALQTVINPTQQYLFPQLLL
jgi:hypothetical protein